MARSRPRKQPHHAHRNPNPTTDHRGDALATRNARSRSPSPSPSWSPSPSPSPSPSWSPSPSPSPSPSWSPSPRANRPSLVLENVTKGKRSKRKQSRVEEHNVKEENAGEVEVEGGRSDDVHDESQGKHEVPVVYKVGERIPGLVELWKEYESSHPDESLGSLQSGLTLEIQIPAENITDQNPHVKKNELWGTDVYTADSDLVAVLLHSGYWHPSTSGSRSAIQQFRATIQVLPPQESYDKSIKNGYTSRSWGSAVGCSYRVERCCFVKSGGGTFAIGPCFTDVSPTLNPMGAASNAEVLFNLCNEPWLKYSLSVVADRGLEKPHYTSARLKKGDVLYLESHTRRFELCFTGEKMVKGPTGAQGHQVGRGKYLDHSAQAVNADGSLAEGDHVAIDMFRWSRCKEPLPQKQMRSIGIPLPLDHLEVLAENLEWEDILWSQTGVWIAGKEYKLVRAHFLSPS